MWEYDYWRRDADELARQAPESNAQASAEPALPRLRILRDLED